VPAAGKKWKRCRLLNEEAKFHSREDRAYTWAKLERFIMDRLGPKEDDDTGPRRR
jgi:hypothetical protein